jgi:hypothetical protein
VSSVWVSKGGSVGGGKRESITSVVPYGSGVSTVPLCDGPNVAVSAED